MGKRIAIMGAFGIGNTGNEGTLEVMHALLKRIHPDAELTCICTFPDRAQHDHGISAIPLFLHPTAPAFRKINRALLRLPAILIDLYRTFRRAGAFDAIIIPGTGVLDDFSTAPMGWPYAAFKWSLAAKLRGTPVALVSVGAGPITSALSRWFMLRYAGMASYRSYRDDNSKRFMESIGFDTSKDPVYPDLAFAIATEPFAAPPRAEPPFTVGIGVMAYAGWRGADAGIYHAYLPKITQFALWILDSGHRVRLLTGDDVDQPTAEAVLAAIREARPTLPPDAVQFDPPHTLGDVMRQVSETDIVVATRFHNVVSAMKLGRPVVSIGYSKKNDELMAGMGLGEFCQHIEQLDVALLQAQFMRLLAGRDTYIKGMHAANDLLRAHLAEQEAILASRILLA